MNVWAIYVKVALNLFMKKKINSQHKIEKVDYFAQMETKCKKHKIIPITLFCLNEKSKYDKYNF